MIESAVNLCQTGKYAYHDAVYLILMAIGIIPFRNRSQTIGREGLWVEAKSLVFYKVCYAQWCTRHYALTEKKDDNP